MQPIDSAWNVAKGELFHPSVAGYMAQASDPQFPARRMQRPMADRLNTRGAPFRVTDNKQGRIMSPTGEFDHFAHQGRFRRFRPPLPPHSSGLPIAESTDHEQQIQLHGSPRDYGIIDHMHPQEHKDFTEQDMGATGRLNPLMLRSSDSPINTAWSVLKALSREDLQQAARTGGIGMTDARRQAYADQDLPLSTGGGFRTMPDSEAQLMIDAQHRTRQGSWDYPKRMTDEQFQSMGMLDLRGKQLHDTDDFQDPNFEPMADSLEPEGKMGYRLEHASLEDPSFAERHEPEQPEPEFDPELSSFHNRDRRQSPSGEAFTYLKRKKEAEARRMQEVRERGRRMPQQQQRRGGRRPGEGKNAYRNRMNRQRRR